MRIRMLAAALAGAAIALGAVACGGGEEATGVTDTVDSVAQSEGGEPGGGDPLTQLEEALVEAGYRAGETDVSEAEGALSAESPEGAKVSVYLYGNAAEAKAAGEKIEGVFAEHPGRGLVEVRGGFVATAAAERQLNAAEKEALTEVAELAEGVE